MDNSERIELLKQAMIKLYEAYKLVQEADPGDDDGEKSGAINWLCWQIHEVNEKIGRDAADSILMLLEHLGEDYENIPIYADIF